MTSEIYFKIIQQGGRETWGEGINTKVKELFVLSC